MNFENKVRYLNEFGIIQEKDLVCFWARLKLHEVSNLCRRMLCNQSLNPKKENLYSKSKKLCA